MSRFTPLGRVGRRSLGAVLLLACFGARRAMLASAVALVLVVLVVAPAFADERSVTIELSEPEQRSSTDVLNAEGTGVQAAEWCRTMTGVFTHSGQYRISSATYWCWNGTIITHVEVYPPFYERLGGSYFVWDLDYRSVSGGVGNWYHDDQASWTARKCGAKVGGLRRPKVGWECDDKEYHFLNKSQYHDGRYHVDHQEV